LLDRQALGAFCRKCHPARMCVDMVAVRHAVSAAAGTSGDIADTNYMLVPWPEMCDADAAAAVAAETAVSPEHTRGRGRSGAAAVVTMQKVATSGSACLQQPCLHPL